MKKWQTPQDVYNKDADQTVPPHNPMPVFIQPGMFYSFWHVNSWLQNISLIVFKSFSVALQKWWQVRTYSNLWSDKLPLIALHVPLVR